MVPKRFFLPIIILVAFIAGANLAAGEDSTGAKDGAKASDEAPKAEDGAPTPSPATTVLTAREDDHAFTIVVEPGRPSLGRRVNLRLDLATIPENPHPTFGDRVPVRDATLVAVLSSPKEDGAVHRQTLHPYGGAGTYGLHWTPSERGLWRLSIERIGEKLPSTSFRIGVDVNTPAQSDPTLERGLGGPSRILGGLDRGQRGGGVVGPLTPVAAGPTASSVMSSFSEPAGRLVGAFSDRADPVAAREAMAALLPEAKKLPGTVPQRYEVGAEDYDRLANQLVQRLEALASTVEAQEMEKARSEWRSALDQTCAQCHVKFWWGISSDLSSWPSVRSQPWRR